MSKGKILVLSGPSGAGKGTVVNRILEMDDNVVLSISATTRAMREGEEEGVHYFYITQEEFLKKIENNELLEYNCYNQNYYGTLKSYVDSLLASGKNVLLEIDVNGAFQIKEKRPDAITVFLTAPSIEEIERRLKKRNTETDDVISRRLEIAKAEIERAPEYDYVVCNEAVDTSAQRILEILNK